MNNPDPVGVLVTRPANQNQHLIKLIEAAGNKAIAFPTLEIKPPRDNTALARIIEDLDKFSMIIFISPNAVEYAVKEIHKPGKKIPQHIKLACIGAGSAKALNETGYDDIITPTEKYNSESLLQHPELQDVAGKHIVIFRGNGGRELLKQTLIKRKADVVYGECYRRAKPDTDNTMLMRALDENAIDVITATSAKAVRNLCEMTDNKALRGLKEIPVVVASPRIAEVCRQLGFRNEIIVSINASDNAIVDSIRQWQTSKNAL